MRLTLFEEIISENDASVAGVVGRLLAVARGRLLGGGLVALAGVLGRVLRRVLKNIAKVKKIFWLVGAFSGHTW